MSILRSKSEILVLLIVAIGIVIVLLFFINNTTHKNEPEHYRPYIYVDNVIGFNAVAVGENAIASSEENATVYGKPVPKNVSIVPYLDDNNKLQVEEVVERQNHTGQGEP